MLTLPQSGKPTDFNKIIRLVDEIFIKSRKRRLSFSKRFPTLFNEQNINNLRIIKDDNEIVSHVGIKYCYYRLKKKKIKIGIVGSVCTRPSYRGMNFASVLMQDAEKQMQKEGADFGILWTRIPIFYKRLGWISRDDELLGKIHKKEKIFNKKYKIDKVKTSEIVLINNLRIKNKNNYIIRKSVDLRSILGKTIPLPAENQTILGAKSASGLEAYIAFGNEKKDLYIYEIEGKNDAASLLIDSIFSLFNPKKVFWNCKKDDPRIFYLKKYFNITFTKKRLAMWKIFNQKYEKELSNIYIPFLDRI